MTQLRNKKAPNNPFLMDEVKRYEEYQFKLAQSLVAKPKSEEGVYCLRKEFLPQYLIQRAASPIINDLPLEAILGQIVACIESELQYYEENKTGLPDFIASVKIAKLGRAEVKTERTAKNVFKAQRYRSAGAKRSYQSDEDSFSDLTEEEEDSEASEANDFSHATPTHMVPPRTRLIPASQSSSQETTQQVKGASRAVSIDKGGMRLRK